MKTTLLQLWYAVKRTKDSKSYQFYPPDPKNRKTIEEIAPDHGNYKVVTLIDIINYEILENEVFELAAKNKALEWELAEAKEWKEIFASMVEGETAINERWQKHNKDLDDHHRRILTRERDKLIDLQKLNETSNEAINILASKLADQKRELVRTEMALGSEELRFKNLERKLAEERTGFQLESARLEREVLHLKKCLKE